MATSQTGATTPAGRIAAGDPPGFELAPPAELASKGLKAVTGHDAVAKEADIVIVMVPDTPWAVWVEFPSRALLAPARSLLRRGISLALGFLIVGVFLFTIGFNLILLGLLAAWPLRRRRRLARAGGGLGVAPRLLEDRERGGQRHARPKPHSSPPPGPRPARCSAVRCPVPRQPAAPALLARPWSPASSSSNTSACT